MYNEETMHVDNGCSCAQLAPMVSVFVRMCITV